jgi:hypothetical protein
MLPKKTCHHHQPLHIIPSTYATYPTNLALERSQSTHRKQRQRRPSPNGTNRPNNKKNPIPPLRIPKDLEISHLRRRHLDLLLENVLLHVRQEQQRPPCHADALHGDFVHVFRAKGHAVLAGATHGGCVGRRSTAIMGS